MNQKYHALCETCKSILTFIEKREEKNNYYLHYDCKKCKKGYEYSLIKGVPYFIHKSFYLSHDPNYKNKIVLCPSCKKKLDFIYCSWPQEGDMSEFFKCEHCHQKNPFKEVILL